MIDSRQIPVVILCGGKGTRLREETEYRPKPLVKIGRMPILWHIMKLYSFYGHKNFVLLLGYKGEMIKDYFLNFEVMANDFTLKLRGNNEEKILLHNQAVLEDWDITFIDTEEDTPTGGRVLKAREYLKNYQRFMLTYGDGVADVNINQLLSFHFKKKKTGTLMGVRPSSQFGIIETSHGLVTSFKEKPNMDGYINGGFFVFENNIFNILKDNSILEQEPLKKLTKKKDLAVYRHQGFWQCMDTYKQAEWLNDAWDKGNHPWTVWDHDEK